MADEGATPWAGGRGLAAAAGAVAVVALAAQRLLSHGPSAGEVGDVLFGALGLDLVTFVMPATYFRLTIQAKVGEPVWARALCAAIVGAAAHVNLWLWPTDYALLLSVLVASYVLMCGRFPSRAAAVGAAAAAAAAVAGVAASGQVVALARLASGGVAAWGAHVALLRRAPWKAAALGWVLCFAGGALLLPYLTVELACFLLPVEELKQAYGIIEHYMGSDQLRERCGRLLLITVLCQVSLGYLGIAFIRRGQERKNALVYVGDGQGTALDFSKLIGRYMLMAALPYMLQRTVMENVNSYAFGVFAQEVDRSLRVRALFPGGPGGTGGTALAAVQGSTETVESYTDALDAIVSVSYGVVEEKLFAVPKLMLLPGMLLKRPWLVVTVLPAAVGLDVARASVIASLNKRLEAMKIEINKLTQRRRKVESHDTKHEELIRRGATSEFAEAQWRDIAAELADKSLRLHALGSLRSFLNFLYKQDLLLPGIELVLAWLLEARHIPSSDIWVYTRVIEDAIDLLLTRFRMDATLATMRTHMLRVEDLTARLGALRARGHATCSADPAGGALRIRGLRFTRGSAHQVQIHDLVLRSGRIYMVTGPNGSGKSSLFGMLASCGRHSAVLPDGLEIQELETLVVPSGDIVEVTQQLYCPLFTKPIAWLLQRRHFNTTVSPDELAASEERIANLSARLAFRGADSSSSQATGLSVEELHTEQDDWYSTLSGGQRVKVELMRKIFLKDRCPGVLLIDEAFAPLDPASKATVQRMLKEFCSESLVLVIYHTDANEPCLSGEGGFFDENLQFGNGTVELTSRCQA